MRAPRYVGRDRDERDLKILRMWVAGMTSTAISRQIGMSRGAVVGLIKRIRDDDVALSGERGVAPHYEQRAAAP